MYCRKLIDNEWRFLHQGRSSHVLRGSRRPQLFLEELEARIVPTVIPPVPSGLVAVIRNDAGPDPAPTLDLTPFTKSYISGVAFQIDWRDIEPVEGKPLNWARLDELFAAADSSGKWVQLLISPGFWSPTWVLNDPDVVTHLFNAQYTHDQGLPQMPLPMPWDRAYLGDWFAFLNLVKDRYGDNPEFRMIAAAGPTSVSDEATEPNSPNDITNWMEYGYTENRYLQAWQEVFAFYAKEFPTQYVSLSIGPGVKIAPDEPQITRQALVDEASATLTDFKDQFAFQSSSLSGTQRHVTDHKLVIHYNGDFVTGFQLADSCENQPAYMGAPGDPPLALTLSIDNGMLLNANHQHVTYIEVYTEDLKVADLQPELRWASSLFQ